MSATTHTGSGALAGQVTFVTGGGQGIGLGMATAFAAAGATVVLADLDLARAEAAAADLADTHDSPVHALCCDVGSREEITAAVDATVERFGRLDVLVNNAHDVRVGPIDGLTSADVEASWRTGVLGCIRGMQVAHPHLRGGGRIINVVSPVMLKSNPAGFGLYAACKEAIRTLTRTAAVEWGRDGIRVNAIAPQAASPAWADWSAANPEAAEQIRREVLLGRIGDAVADVGPVAVFLASDASRYVTGSLLGADGGRGYLR